MQVCVEFSLNVNRHVFLFFSCNSNLEICVLLIVDTLYQYRLLKISELVRFSAYGATTSQSVQCLNFSLANAVQ